MMAKMAKKDAFEHRNKMILASFCWLGAAILCGVAFWCAFGFVSFINTTPSSSFVLHVPSEAQALVWSTDGQNYYAAMPEQEILLSETVAPLKSLNVQLTLVLSNDASKNEMNSKLASLQDAIIAYLRLVRVNELQQTGQLFVMKEALIDKLNHILPADTVKDILFSKITIKEAV